MKVQSAGSYSGISRFRLKLCVAIMLVTGVISIIGVGFAERYMTRQVERELQELIERQIGAATHTRNVRQAVLAEICDGLAHEPRIHAALEDDALDLLYPSAANELRKIRNLNARFYRFLNAEGGLIEPGTEAPVQLPEKLSVQEPDYILLPDAGGLEELVEVFTVPIISNETLLPIASLVVGFPYEIGADLANSHNLRAGVWINGRLLAPDLDRERRTELAAVLGEKIRKKSGGSGQKNAVWLDEVEHRVILQLLNSGSGGRRVYEVFIASMEELSIRQKRLRKQIFAVAGMLALLGLGASQLIARRLAGPVETELDSTHRKLERAARYSADASHQLKTPLTVMRAGLEELRVEPSLPGSLYGEVDTLIRQTDRLTAVIDDLLLLSRLDAGYLQLVLKNQSLRQLVDALIDDFSILPDAEQLRIEISVADDLIVLGDRSYTTLVLQCLLENARKYNRPGGIIRIYAERIENNITCRIGNTGETIPLANQPYIFERFHRGPVAENVSGYGLGLNLARELAILHGGNLHLRRSRDDWTEFELILQAAT